MTSLAANTPVIVAARRTAIGRRGGIHAHLEVEHLAAPVLRAVLNDTGIDPAYIDDVILGNAAGPGGNVARLSLLEAGLPVSVPGVAIDRQCGSGLEAINIACRLIQSGGASIVLAGGVESASRQPLRAMPDDPPAYYTRARFSPDSVGDPEMIEAAQNVAQMCDITREDQDAFALRSHENASRAQANGVFDAEIVSLNDVNDAVKQQDSCIRSDTSLDKLAALEPLLGIGTTITAGNACPMNDGAAVVLIVSAEVLNTLPAMARQGLAFVDSAAAGVHPNVLGLGPVASTRKLLGRNAGLDLKNLARVEFNEAFAAQVLGSLRQLNIREDIVNPSGGALALGHPYGASGAILAVRLFNDLHRNPVTAPVVATIGIGGGQGISTLFQWVDRAS